MVLAKLHAQMQTQSWTRHTNNRTQTNTDAHTDVDVSITGNQELAYILARTSIPTHMHT